MRLTTLARKIEQTPGQLIEFLEKNEIEIPNGLHTKLDQETIEMVMDHFLPDRPREEEEMPAPVETVAAAPSKVPADAADATDDQADTTGSKAEQTVEEAEASMPDSHIIAEAEEDVATVAEPKIGTIEDLENEEEIDLIKVKKVKLEGIKVVGKIDLPEKPKKEEKPADEGQEVDKEGEQKRRLPAGGRKFDRQRKKNRGKNRKSLTYEEKIKEEERQKLKLRRRRENEEKRRKKKFYEQNIKPKTVAPSKKKRKKTSGNQQEARQEVAPHRNPIVRLWEWLNGKYDRY